MAVNNPFPCVPSCGIKYDICSCFATGKMYKQAFVVLSHQQTMVLSHHQTMVLSHQQTMVLSHHQTMVLSHQQTFASFLPLDVWRVNDFHSNAGDVGYSVAKWSPTVSKTWLCLVLYLVSSENSMAVFIHLSATGVAETAKSTHLKGCPHTFVYIVKLFLGTYFSNW